MRQRRGTGVTNDLIEGYLDRLPTQLRGSAHDVRRILSETEEHLRDATAELVLLGAVGLASGALAELLGRVFGPAFVAGDALTRLPANAPGSPSQSCRRPPG